MGDIGDRLRALFDEEARPIDPAHIPGTVRQRFSVRRRFSGRPVWQVGIAAGLIALVFGGAALLLRMDGDGGTAGQTVSATQPNEVGPGTSSQAADVVVPQGLPLLVLELPDTRIVEVSTIFDQSTGTPVGIQTTYDTRLGPYGCFGRSTLLWIQQPAADTAQFDYLTSMAESTDIVLVGGREVTVYAIPDEAIAEGNYDLGILRWTEAPGYDVFLIPWGLGPDEALALLDRLQVVNESEWGQLVGLIDTSTNSYPVECNEPISFLPRVVIDLPGFEIVGGSEWETAQGNGRGEWQIQIGETTGTITVDSDQTTPSKTFVDYDNPEEVTIVAYPPLLIPGLLARYDDGFIVEWQLDTRFTVSIDGTDIDPLALVEAIRDVDEATWRQLLPDSPGIPHYTISPDG